MQRGSQNVPSVRVQRLLVSNLPMKAQYNYMKHPRIQPVIDFNNEKLYIFGGHNYQKTELTLEIFSSTPAGLKPEIVIDFSNCIQALSGERSNEFNL